MLFIMSPSWKCWGLTLKLGFMYLFVYRQHQPCHLHPILSNTHTPTHPSPIACSEVIDNDILWRISFIVAYIWLLNTKYIFMSIRTLSLQCYFRFVSLYVLEQYRFRPRCRSPTVGGDLDGRCSVSRFVDIYLEPWRQRQCYNVWRVVLLVGVGSQQLEPSHFTYLASAELNGFMLSGNAPHLGVPPMVRIMKFVHWGPSVDSTVMRDIYFMRDSMGEYHQWILSMVV